MTRYTVFFHFGNNPIQEPTNMGIADLLNGFWVNDKFEMTKGQDGKYFIPPSQIRYIKKN